MLKQKLKTKHTIRKAGYAPVKCLKSQLYNRPPMHIPLGAVLNCFDRSPYLRAGLEGERGLLG